MESVRNIIITIISMCFLRSRGLIFKYYIGNSRAWKEPVKAHWLLYVQPDLTFQDSASIIPTRCFCESCRPMRTALLLYVYSIICSAFTVETECVYCEVWAESLNKFQVTCRLWMAAANAVIFSFSVTDYCSRVPSFCAYSCVTWINIKHNSMSLLRRSLLLMSLK